MGRMTEMQEELNRLRKQQMDASVRSDDKCEKLQSLISELEVIVNKLEILVKDKDKDNNNG